MSLNTWITTRLFGEPVGEDEFGNRYFRSAKLSRYGRERRWVVYKGKNEASTVPAEWHAWLHHMTDVPLTGTRVRRWPWQKPHLPNATGTLDAFRPKGHDLAGGQRARGSGDYEPWVPS